MPYLLTAKVVATSNINITTPGVTSIDGVPVSGGDRVLLVNQTTAHENGVWLWGTPLSRPASPDPFYSGSTTLDNATFVAVSSGNIYEGSKWRLYDPQSGAITVDTTSITFSNTIQVFDVRDFGAVCDNSTDDSAAIQAAINAASGVVPPGGLEATGGGEVLIPGNCAIANPIFIGTPPTSTFVAWSSGESVAADTYTNTYNVPTTANGYYYGCVNAGTGTTGSTEPTWPTTIGAMTSADSNGVVWMCWGQRWGTFVWSSGEPVTTNTYNVPTTANGYYYKCTNAGSGTTTGSEPAWPTIFGQATPADANGVVWTCWGLTNVHGVRLRAPARPTDFSPVTLRWSGSSSPFAMLSVRAAYGGGVENIGFDAQGGARYCLQFQQVRGDLNPIEHWNVDRCFFTNAGIENVLLGDPDICITEDNDVSLVCFNNCLFLQWEGQVGSEPSTLAHVAHNAYNGLGNTFLGCQFTGSAGTGKAITGITTGVSTTVTCPGHGFTNGELVIFSGTGIQKLDDNGVPWDGTAMGVAVSSATSTTFVVAVNTSGATWGGAGYAYKLGYPLYGVVAAVGRCAMYNCIDVGLGICTVFAPTPRSGGLFAGGISIYEHESQGANFAAIQPEHSGIGGAAPFVFSGVRHGDIWGFGAYSVMWNRYHYATLNVVGGLLGRGLVHDGTESNVTLAGPAFAASLGQLSGTSKNLVNGWWFVDGTQHTHFANAVEWRARTVLSDADQTISVASETWVLPNAPTMPRLITLSFTAAPTFVGQRLRITVPALQHVSVSGEEYKVTRNNGSSQVPVGLLCSICSSTTNVPKQAIFADFEFAEGLVLSVTGTASGVGGVITLTLSAPAGAVGNPTDTLALDDWVVVSGVMGTTEANGTWLITVVDATHISLNGSTWVHAWTSGGTVQITPGVWRLAASSGASWDGSAKIGVVPDSGS